MARWLAFDFNTQEIGSLARLEPEPRFANTWCTPDRGLAVVQTQNFLKNFKNFLFL